MAEIKFTIPDPQMSRVLHALAVKLNVRDEIGNLDESGAAVKAEFVVWIKNAVRSVEAADQASIDGDDFGDAFTSPDVD